jgi:hypothetical protein
VAPLLLVVQAKRIYEQLQDICAILSGLVVANDYKVNTIIT